MDQELNQNQHNKQELKIENGNISNQSCSVLLSRVSRIDSMVPIIVRNGVVTQVLCRYLSRDGNNKCTNPSNINNDCYFYPAWGEP